MKQEVLDILRICRVFYITMHAIAILIFISFNNPCTTISISSGTFWFLKFFSGILFFITRNSPGYLSSSPSPDLNELQDSDWQVPSHKFCDICHLTQPYRSKHCDLCEECVSKYDHHCFWLGACIGELNHFKFSMYLLIESIAIWWACYYCIDGGYLI